MLLNELEKISEISIGLNKSSNCISKPNNSKIKLELDIGIEDYYFLENNNKKKIDKALITTNSDSEYSIENTITFFDANGIKINNETIKNRWDENVAFFRINSIYSKSELRYEQKKILAIMLLRNWIV